MSNLMEMTIDSMEGAGGRMRIEHHVDFHAKHLCPTIRRLMAIWLQPECHLRKFVNIFLFPGFYIAISGAQMENVEGLSAWHTVDKTLCLQ